MADKERLIGSDGKLVTITIGTTLNGDASSTLDELVGGTSGDGTGKGWYKISAIASTSSVIPAGLAVDDLFWDDGSLVLATGDNVDPLTEVEQSDVTSFNIDISRAEVDVTPLGNSFKVYRTGNRDMQGSLEGITVIGVTDASGWIINNFIRTIKQAADQSVVVTEVEDSPVYLKGYVQKDTKSGETEAFIWCRVNLLSTSFGASGEDAQAFSSNFRIAPDSVAPTLYLREIA